MAANFFDPPFSPLPHPEIHFAVLLIIEEGLRKAWEMLRLAQLPDFDLTKAREDEITQQFRLVICNQVLKNRMVDGFTLDLFRVGREAKYENYNGDNTEKMPDLIVDIIGRDHVARPSDDGLFIECKPVDKNHPAGAIYCDDGLIRFVNGSYAWTMSQAMMIGYASEGYTVLPKLHDALEVRSTQNSFINKNARKRIETIQFPSPCLDPKSKGKSWCEPVHITCHKRVFSYKQTNTPAPPITLRHLWLKRD